MIEEEVKPLYTPSYAYSYKRFICNINGEVSLWNINGRLRAYTSHARGASVRDLLPNPNSHLEILRKWPTMREHAEILRRNIDAILVYGAMLEETRSDVG